MRKFATIVVCIGMSIGLSGCLGDSSTNNSLEGQVKKIEYVTPLIFSDYTRVDVSLGVLRNGVGSMSKEDMWLYVPNSSDLIILEEARKSGTPVSISYNEARFRWYVEEPYVTHVELSK